jgi:hypothetical protein
MAEHSSSSDLQNVPICTYRTSDRVQTSTNESWASHVSGAQQEDGRSSLLRAHQVKHDDILWQPIRGNGVSRMQEPINTKNLMLQCCANALSVSVGRGHTG